MADDNHREKDEQPSEKQTDEKQPDDKQKKSDKSQEEKEQELETLLKQLKELQKQRHQLDESRQSKKTRMLMIEFGAVFHNNGILNYVMYFLLNLVIIYALTEVIAIIGFTGELIDLLAFVAVYTLIEILFRQYIVFNHFRLIMRSFGFIFFFGYLTLFYFLERYLFDGMFTFLNETFFVLFIALFVLLRYILSYVIRHIVLRMMRW